ncbi:transposase (plasmid) [Salmonella enterica subsp. enterica]|nr:transposase [Salmonella enterica subsp. enterica]
MRSERALKLAIAEMYVKVSTRRSRISSKFFVAPEVSSSQVSRLAKGSMKRYVLEGSLSDRFNTVLGTTYESVRVGSHVVKQALLVAVALITAGISIFLTPKSRTVVKVMKLAFLSRGYSTTRDARPANDHQ